MSPFRDLHDVRDNEDTAIPVLMIDTAGCDLTELDVPDEMSKANEGRNTWNCLNYKFTYFSPSFAIT